MKKERKLVLMITPYFYPHLGGVEKHVLEISRTLVNRGFNVEVITDHFQNNLAKNEELDGIKIFRFLYPKIKFIGLIVIWWQMVFRYLAQFRKADAVHVHDVMIWILPVRVLFPRKKIVLTMHGWEGVFPIPKKNIFLKKISAIFANKVICVGEYIGKYYHLSCDKVIYGGVSGIFSDSLKHKQNSLVYLGRLETDAGLPTLLKSLNDKCNLDMIFVGDGSLRSQCEKYGKVLGWLPEKKIANLLASTSWCVASGYLSALEALASGCEVIVIADNQLKQDYWQLGELNDFLHIIKNSQEMSQIINQIEIKKIRSKNTFQKTSNQFSWEKLTDQYLQIYFS